MSVLSRPGIKATAMWLCLFKDRGKAGWLLENVQDLGAKVRAKLLLGNYSYEDLASLDYSEWFNIETLIVFSPIFVNTTIASKSLGL